MAEERESFNRQTANLDIQLKELQNRIRSKEKEFQELNEERIKLAVTLQNSSQQTSELKHQVAKLEQQLSFFLTKQKENGTFCPNKADGLVPPEEQQAEQELSNARLEIQNLTEQLEQV